MTRRFRRPAHDLLGVTMVRVTVREHAVTAHAHGRGADPAPRRITLATARRLAVAGVPLVVDAG
jgi:hypothetical protein